MKEEWGKDAGLASNSVYHTPHPKIPLQYTVDPWTTYGFELCGSTYFF